MKFINIIDAKNSIVKNLKKAGTLSITDIKDYLYNEFVGNCLTDDTIEAAIYDLVNQQKIMQVSFDRYSA